MVLGLNFGTSPTYNSPIFYLDIHLILLQSRVLGTLNTTIQKLIIWRETLVAGKTLANLANTHKFAKV